MDGFTREKITSHILQTLTFLKAIKGRYPWMDLEFPFEALTLYLGENFPKKFAIIFFYIRLFR